MKVPDRIYTVQTYALDGCVMFAYYFGKMYIIGFIRMSFGGPLNSSSSPTYILSRPRREIWAAPACCD